MWAWEWEWAYDEEFDQLLLVRFSVGATVAFLLRLTLRSKHSEIKDAG